MRQLLFISYLACPLALVHGVLILNVQIFKKRDTINLASVS